jgi:hypothetical protein
VAGASPVPFRCGRGEPSPVVDVAVPSQSREDVAGASPFPGAPVVWATGRRPQVVTLNYRVGPLGFGTFRRADGTVDANWGLQDQREALRYL